MSPEENPNNEDLSPSDTANPANPANPAPVDADGVVLGAPAYMLLPRVVPVPETLGTKEDEDETKRLVVRYDPFMQVVNGMSGSGAGNMRRMSEILHKAVDRDAVGQFNQAIEQANIAGQEVGRQAAVQNYADELASKDDVISQRNQRIEELSQLIEERDEALGKMQVELDASERRAGILAEEVLTLKDELAEAKKPAAQRAKPRAEE